MLETIKNGFVALLDILLTAWEFVTRLIANILQLLSVIPHLLNNLSLAITSIPTIFLVPATFVISVSVASMIINHKPGGD